MTAFSPRFFKFAALFSCLGLSGTLLPAAPAPEPIASIALVQGRVQWSLPSGAYGDVAKDQVLTQGVQLRSDAGALVKVALDGGDTLILGPNGGFSLHQFKRSDGSTFQVQLLGGRLRGLVHPGAGKSRLELVAAGSVAVVKDADFQAKLAPLPALPPAIVVGSITGLSGTARATDPAGSEAEAFVGLGLAPGTAVRSPAGCFVELTLRDGNLLTLYPDSEASLSVQDAGGVKRTLINLVSGRLRGKFKGLDAKDRVALVTVNGVAELSDGEFEWDMVPALVGALPAKSPGKRSPRTLLGPVPLLLDALLFWGAGSAEADPLTDPSAGVRAPGLYVQVIDGAINLANPGGSQSFMAGQFGFVANSSQPPVIIPSNPGFSLNAPPAISHFSQPAIVPATPPTPAPAPTAVPTTAPTPLPSPVATAVTAAPASVPNSGTAILNTALQIQAIVAASVPLATLTPQSSATPAKPSGLPASAVLLDQLSALATAAQAIPTPTAVVSSADQAAQTAIQGLSQDLTKGQGSQKAGDPERVGAAFQEDLKAAIVQVMEAALKDAHLSASSAEGQKLAQAITDAAQKAQQQADQWGAGGVASVAGAQKAAQALIQSVADLADKLVAKATQQASGTGAGKDSNKLGSLGAQSVAKPAADSSAPSTGQVLTLTVFSAGDAGVLLGSDAAGTGVLVPGGNKVQMSASGDVQAGKVTANDISTANAQSGGLAELLPPTTPSIQPVSASSPAGLWTVVAGLSTVMATTQDQVAQIQATEAYYGAGSAQVSQLLLQQQAQTAAAQQVLAAEAQANAQMAAGMSSLVGAAASSGASLSSVAQKDLSHLQTTVTQEAQQTQQERKVDTFAVSAPANPAAQPHPTVPTGPAP